MGEKELLREKRFDAIFTSLDKQLPVNEIDDLLIEVTATHRGEAAVRKAVNLITGINGVGLVIELPGGSEEDRAGKDLQVFFDESDPIDFVWVQVKASLMGVSKFRNQTRKYLSRRRKEVVTWKEIEDYYHEEKLIVIHTNQGKKKFYADFFNQLRSIVEWQKSLTE